MFWDSVEITVKAGDGGRGMISFRTELGEAKGGPDGGDGGRGGNVVMVANRNHNTLLPYARQKLFKAESGIQGAKARRHGKAAEDLRLAVPVGTMVLSDGKQLADLTVDGQEFRVAKGGRGGFGNAHFTSSVRQTPRQAELGEPGEERPLKLELKLVADIGLVGLPSVGKSTLLSRVTAATPKIADYPFTTTVPQLGIAQVDEQAYVIADIPGLIEGAHQGKGLGDAFLRHIERTKAMLHLLDATRPDPVEDYRKIRHELEAFGPGLANKPELIAINKMDALDGDLRKLLLEDIGNRLGQNIHLISAVSGEGVTDLLHAAAGVSRREKPAEPAEVVPTFTLSELAPKAVSVTKGNDGSFEVKGETLERLAKQTDFTNREAARRFWWVFGRLGASKRLDKLGAKADAPVLINGVSLKWPG